MKAYVVAAPGELALIDRSDAQPGPEDVVIEVAAVALNRRDLTLLTSAKAAGRDATGLVLCSDAAGKVIARGSRVKAFDPGDEVVTRFLPQWLADRPPRRDLLPAFGGPEHGVLQERVCAPESFFSHRPAGWSAAAAATLPCAGLTAWRALQSVIGLPGSCVLIHGTGGVSIFALQFAKALGAHVGVVTRHARKRERLEALGADRVFLSGDDWEQEAVEFAGGLGPDLVIDMGAAGSLEGSSRAAAPGGSVAVVGVLAGLQAPVDLRPLIQRGVSLQGINAGSVQHFDSMLAFLRQSPIRPVIDSIFEFPDAVAAFARLQSGDALGKIAVSVTSRRDRKFPSDRTESVP